MSNKKSTKCGLIINRLKSGLGLKTDKNLCDLLDIKPATLSSWRSRDTLDYQLIFANCKDLSIHWLVTGEGPMRLDETLVRGYDASESEYLNSGEEGDSEVDKWKEKYLLALEENRELRIENDRLRGIAPEKPQGQGRQRKVL